MSFLEPLEPVVSSEEVKALIHSPCSLAFQLPTDVSLDDKDDPIKFSVTHNNEPIDTFDMIETSDENKTEIHKLFEEIKSVDAGDYVITVDIGRQQYIHKLTVSVGKHRSLHIH